MSHNKLLQQEKSNLISKISHDLRDMISRVLGLEDESTKQVVILELVTREQPYEEILLI